MFVESKVKDGKRRRQGAAHSKSDDLMNDVNAKTVESEIQGNFDHQKQVVEGDAEVLWVHREASVRFEGFVFFLGK